MGLVVSCCLKVLNWAHWCWLYYFEIFKLRQHRQLTTINWGGGDLKLSIRLKARIPLRTQAVYHPSKGPAKVVFDLCVPLMYSSYLAIPY